uniref:Uncharacterized protein n=1 Tax=Rhizophora mucronata TaxID=61149 RepID=A0A2P2LYX3_RHIMU
MEMLASSATLYPSHHFTVSNTGRYACRSTLFSINPQAATFFPCSALSAFIFLYNFLFLCLSLSLMKFVVMVALVLMLH